MMPDNLHVDSSEGLAMVRPFDRLLCTAMFVKIAEQVKGWAASWANLLRTTLLGLG